MALYILINTIVTPQKKWLAGTVIDDAANPFAQLVRAGAYMVAAGVDPIVDGAAARCQAAHASKGANELELAIIMLAALATSAAVGTREVFGPERYGWINWTYDRALFAGSSTITAGIAHCCSVIVPNASTISKLVLHVAIAGGTLTSGQCFAALYQNNVLLGVTADQSVAWATTGCKEMSLVTPAAVQPGVVDVAFWYQGTTSPAFTRANGNETQQGSMNPLRFALANTGLTTTPPATLAKTASMPTAIWAAVA